MNGEKISRCLDALPDEMLSEAMRPYRPRSLGWHIVRIAACLAIVIGLTIALWPKEETPGAQLETPTEGTTVTPTMPTEVPPETLPRTYYAAPGILKLYSYTQQSVPAEELEKYEIINGISKYQPIWMEHTNAREIKMTFYIPQDYYEGEKIIIKVVAPYGYYLGANGESVEIENGKTSSWRPGKDLQNMKEALDPGAFYVYLLIYAGDRPVGFGLLELSCLTLPAGPYAVTLRAFQTVCYPLVDGQFQDITEEYLWEQISEYEHTMHEEYLEHLPDMLEKLNKEYESRLN